VEPCNPEPDGKPGPNGAAAEAFLPLVGAIARALRRGLPPTVELDELINDGVLGLFTALERYDPSRGVGFSTYAGHRIRGAMLDGLRQRDPLPRTYRRALKAAESAGIQFLELDHALTVPADEADGPEALVLEADLRDQVWRGLQALPSRDREVLELRMVRGLPLRAVAAHLCLSVTRIAEIQTRGVTRLRRFMAGEALAQPRRKGSLKSNEWGPAASQEGSENRAPLWKCL
jgi:RNA polymerase sigma factor for flagellar operon FliA